MKVCLVMIVKNEAKRIKATLDSARPFVDMVSIVDTGSTDGTQDIIREHLRDMRGELHERPWKNFGANRTESYRLAEKTIGDTADWYMLCLDAGDFFGAVPGFAWPAGDGLDGFNIAVRCSDCVHVRVHLLKAGAGWISHLPVHEHPHLPGARMGLLKGCEYISTDPPEGRPVTRFLDDASLLETELATNPGDPRCQFYLAQSYWCALHTEKALEAYRLRAANVGGWDEERWYAQYRVMMCAMRLGLPTETVIKEGLKAFEMRPTRAEPLYHLSRWLRESDPDSGARALPFALAAAALEPPKDWLWVETSVYRWGAVDEACTAAGWAGLNQMGITFGEQAIKTAPKSEHARIYKNLSEFAARK